MNPVREVTCHDMFAHLPGVQGNLLHSLPADTFHDHLRRHPSKDNDFLTKGLSSNFTQRKQSCFDAVVRG
jgi:hypothetical protein